MYWRPYFLETAQIDKGLDLNALAARSDTTKFLSFHRLGSKYIRLWSPLASRTITSIRYIKLGIILDAH